MLQPQFLIVSCCCVVFTTFIKTRVLFDSFKELLNFCFRVKVTLKVKVKLVREEKKRKTSLSALCKPVNTHDYTVSTGMSKILPLHQGLNLQVGYEQKLCISGQLRMCIYIYVIIHRTHTYYVITDVFWTRLIVVQSYFQVSFQFEVECFCCVFCCFYYF